KQEKAVELGFTSPHVHLPQNATQQQLLDAIKAFNEDPAVDGMLIQHPTPPQIDYEAALLTVDPDKDVDAAHPLNMGRLAAGVPGIVQPQHIRPGGVVIGAGVRYEGRKLLPDVDVACEEVAGWITPRVGGVGPTTIAMLFRNAVEAAERRAAK